MHWKLRLDRVVITLVFACAALGGGCKIREPRTQVMLIVDADARVRELATDLQVTIEGRNSLEIVDTAPLSYAFELKQPGFSGWPYSIALVPRSRDEQRTYRVMATLSNSVSAIAVVRAEGGFVAQKSVALRLTFTKDCLDGASLVCTNHETCQSGGCISAHVDARTLTAYDDVVSSPGVAADGGVVATGIDKPAVSMRDGGTPNAGDAQAGVDGRSVEAGVDGTRHDSLGNCGDGTVNLDELCDTGIAEGAGACPTLCASVGCMAGRLEGTGCQTKCVPYENTAIESGDGCCPMGADATKDSDCAVVCGNGRVENGETCEAADALHPCPTPESCGADKCLVASITGNAALCTALCETQLIDQCVAGDGCCPSSCTHDLDGDCSASCGNGVLDATAGETCDKTSVENPCPTACDDSNACTRDFLTGSVANCSAACLYVPITTPYTGDGCCPEGANASNDSDCMAMCGNGVIESGELCDGFCPSEADCDDGRYCTRDTLSGSGCGVKCAHADVVNPEDDDFCCPWGANANNDNDCRAACGNGVRESGEDCDGDCPSSCARTNLACTENVLTGTPCHFRCVTQRITEPSNNDGCCPAGATNANDNDCVPPPATCGNNLVETGERCDGNCPPCADTDPCTRDVVGGTPCNPTCSHLAATAGVMDGCCPEGASSDPDCKPTQVCGNGMREGDETCDGVCRACSTSMDPCITNTHVAGIDECHFTCVQGRRTASGKTKDGCCPNGTTPGEDADCDPGVPIRAF